MALSFIARMSAIKNVFKSYSFRSIATTRLRYNEEPSNVIEPPIPIYEEKVGESLKLKKARLLYQSRKRGMLENGLLLSTFAAKYLNGFNEEQAQQYDRLINQPSNDWDIFYWATGVKPTPEEFETPIMELLKDFIKNKERVMKIRQPDLEFS